MRACVRVAYACLCISMCVCLLQLCFSAAGFFFFFDGKGNRCCRDDVASLKKKQQLNMKEALMAEVFCSSSPVTFILMFCMWVFLGFFLIMRLF